MDMVFLLAVTDNFSLLMADSDKKTGHFTFLILKFISIIYNQTKHLLTLLLLVI